jgi:hypothetical protein
MSDSPRETNPTLLALFDEPSLRERWRRIGHGLRQPRGSGEHKWALFQMKRLLSPVSAVVVPALLVLLISMLAVSPSTVESDLVITMRKAPDPTRPLPEKIEPVVVLPDPEIVFSTEPATSTPGLSSPDPVAPPQVSALSRLPTTGVIQTRSPITLPHIYSQRGAAASGGATGLGSGATAGTEGAVLKALRWLKSVQNDDGSWTLASGEGDGTQHGSGAAPAMTGLALLTYLAHGETPNSEEFGYTVESALKWLCSAQQADGHFKGRDSHDYSHPIATFALCEAYGMTQNPLLASTAERAVRVLIDGQNEHGGWTYNCKPASRNDLSYTGWCVQAIKAAKFAGLTCEGLDGALERAVGGLCHNASPGGTFGYDKPAKSHLTGVGVSGLQLLGYKSPQHIARGLAVLEAATCDWDAPLGSNPIYYWYYITQSKRMAGGKMWADWNQTFSTEMASHQVVLPGAGEDGKDIGYWDPASASEHCKSRVYNTTLCTLSLEVYYKIGGFSDSFDKGADQTLDKEDDDEVPILILDV